MSELLELAARVEAAKMMKNALDVECEIALFKPGSVYSAVRANNSGTKVIYTDQAGNEVTCWAEDWTIDAARRASTAAALRARSTQGDPSHDHRPTGTGCCRP